MDFHNAQISALSAQIAVFHRSSVPFRIHHGSTNTTRSARRVAHNVIDTGALNRVVKVNFNNKTCIVEPNVAMDELLDVVLEQHGLIPPVVPEFPGITVGGAFAGTAGESSSWKYGFFDRNVNWIEVVLATGEVVIASEKERPDLFRGAAGTLGTLGVCTLFELRLVEAKRYVELSYTPVTDVRNAQDRIADVTRDPDTTADFVDGIMFARDRGVVMYGTLVNQGSRGNLDLTTFSRSADPWFYLHAQYIRDRGEIHTELVPLRDYLFRYDRGSFWTGMLAFEYFATPFNRTTRWLLDYFMHTRIMYHAFHRSGITQEFVIQDMAVPNRNAVEFVDWVDDNLNVYPLWLCPLKVGRKESGLEPRWNTSDDLEQPSLLNIGVWGRCPNDDFVACNRMVEAKLKNLDGVKWLYSQTFYTEEEFWDIYDKQHYDDLRVKYNATSLPSVYDKVKTDLENERKKNQGIWQIWPMAGVYGVLSALKGGGYLMKS